MNMSSPPQGFMGSRFINQSKDSAGAGGLKLRIFFQVEKGAMEVLVHPGRLTWNIIMEAWKIIFLSKWVICSFQPLIFQGGNFAILEAKTTSCSFKVRCPKTIWVFPKNGGTPKHPKF